MNLRREFEKLIEKKRVEIAEAQRAIDAGQAYIQAMVDAIKKLPKEDLASISPVRAGSEVEKVREVILQAGKPLHLGEIIAALGKPDDAESKAKIAGLLGWYTSKGKVFTKTAPNTYGLVEAHPPNPDIPPDFGAGD